MTARRRRGLEASPLVRTSLPALAGAFTLKDAKRVVLPNGLTLVMLENHRLPIVVAAAVVADVRLREPADKIGVVALVGELLEEGTDKHTGTEIATLIEDAGGSLSVGAERRVAQGPHARTPTSASGCCSSA